MNFALSAIQNVRKYLHQKHVICKVHLLQSVSLAPGEGWRVQGQIKIDTLLAKKAALISGVGEYTGGGVEVAPTVVADLMQVQMLHITAVEKEELGDKGFLFGQDFNGKEIPRWLLHCVRRNKKTFSQSDLVLGGTDVAKHPMTLDDCSRFHMYEEVRQHLIRCWILVSSGPPTAIGHWMWSWWRNHLVDFALILHWSQADQPAQCSWCLLSQIDETLDALAGANYFTSLDLKSGYWQVEMEEEAKQYTAFIVGPLGFYEYNRMPFGLMNAPATFQRPMQRVLGDLHLNGCVVYIDNIIIYTKTEEEHVDMLEKVFQRIPEAGLKLNPKKCYFFQRSSV